MENKFLDNKKEIEKINFRVKEYLWKKSNFFKVREF